MLGRELVATIRTLLDDESFDEDVILQAGTWYQNQIFTQNHTRIMEESDTISISEGDYTGEFPDDMQTMVTLYRTEPTVINMMPFYMQHENFMEHFANFATANEALSSHWTDWGNEIRLSAPVSEDHSFSLDYLRRPVPVVRLTDSYEFPSQYDEMLVRGTLARVMEINEDYAEARTERENMSGMELSFIKNESRGGIKTGPVIIKTGRRATGGRGAFNQW